jgi:hypothetical protein
MVRSSAWRTLETTWPSPQFIDLIILMPIVLNLFAALLIRSCYGKESVRTRIIQMDEVEVSDILVS